MNGFLYRIRLFKRYARIIFWQPPSVPVKVLDNDKTVDYILENKSSVVRFGEGEVQLLCGHNLDFQDFNYELAERMERIIKTPSSNEFLVCIPDVFNGMGNYRIPVQLWWKQHLRQYQEFYKELITNELYGSAFISRPYIDWKKKEIRGGTLKS